MRVVCSGNYSFTNLGDLPDRIMLRVAKEIMERMGMSICDCNSPHQSSPGQISERLNVKILTVTFDDGSLFQCTQEQFESTRYALGNASNVRMQRMLFRHIFKGLTDKMNVPKFIRNANRDELIIMCAHCNLKGVRHEYL